MSLFVLVVDHQLSFLPSHSLSVWFGAGGIKLGAGGLIRAYGTAARQVLREAPVDILIPTCTFWVSCQPPQVGSIYECVAKAGGVTSGERYGDDASLTVNITCDLEVAEQLKTNLNDATRGSIAFLENEEEEE
jgi:putative IMPACT (imprinted ancient) family translation regulator